MRARDQSSIFSTGGKFRPDYGLLLELHALTLVARSYTLLTMYIYKSHTQEIVFKQAFEMDQAMMHQASQASIR